MDAYEWSYVGDVGLRHGGYFWRETGDADTASVVRITPCSDGGGPDNLFRIEVGSVHIPDGTEERSAALAVIGADGPDSSRAELVQAFLTSRGIEADEEYAIRIGPVDALWAGPGDNPEPETVLRAGTSLRKWVTRNYLHAEPVAEPSGPRP